MPRFIEQFYYGNIEPQERSTKMNKSVQKQLEIMMKCEDLLTETLTDEKKQWFLDYVDAWHEWGSESNLDSLLDDFLCNKLPGSDQPRRDDEVYSVVDALQ